MEVFLDDVLVLLLIPSPNDQVVLRADEPEELLKPATANRNDQCDRWNDWQGRVPIGKSESKRSDLPYCPE